MSSWLDDRLRAAARLLLPPSVGDPRIAALYDPRIEHGAMPIRPDRHAVVAALSLCVDQQPPTAQRLKAALKNCAMLELRLLPSGFPEAWDTALAIAISKMVLLDHFSDEAAQRSIQQLLALRAQAQFCFQSPSWQLQALADLALIASADRPKVTAMMKEPLRTLVSDLTLYRSRQDALVEFGGGPADIALSAVLTELPYGGINSTNTAGRLAWRAHDRECVLWLGPGPNGMPTIELWQAGEPVLTTGTKGTPSTVMTIAPSLSPALIKVRRRDAVQAQSLEAVCMASENKNPTTWGRTVTVDTATGRVDVEDWLLPARQQKPPMPWIEGIEFACPSAVALLGLEKIGVDLVALPAQRWALRGQSLKWRIGAVEADPQFVGIKAVVPEAERHRLRAVRWSISPIPPTR